MIPAVPGSSQAERPTTGNLPVSIQPATIAPAVPRVLSERVLSVRLTFALLMLVLPIASQCASQPDFSGMLADYTVDVCVLGGGPSGTAAAIAAARSGSDTLLIEQYGYLGGMGTAASVNVFMPYRYSGGIFREVLHRLDTLPARKGAAFDPNLMRVALDELVAESGAKVLFHTRGAACITCPGKPWQGKERRSISGLIIHNKTGLQRVNAKVFIDCTGDADLAAWSGVPFDVGSEETGEPQPMTMIFRMGGVTYKGGSLMQWPGMEGYWASYCWNPNPGEVTLNMTRIRGYSGINGEDLTAATIAGRRAVLQAVADLRKNVPGFENAHLVAMPEQIGVRETRRIQGATVLTGDQIINPGRIYARRLDVIARNDYDVDIHDPKGTKATIIRLKQPYDIPYRCLLPQGVDNLLVAGRPISADHVAHSSLRIQPTCYALGQAAGTAAAIAVRDSLGPWEVGQGNDPSLGQPRLRELQAILIQQGADLGGLRAKELGLYDEWRRWQLKFRLEAFPMNRDFDDVPPDHVAYDAVRGLVRMGIFRGISETEFGAANTATVAEGAVVIARALAVLPAPEGAPDLEFTMPDHLKGKWWSAGIQECISRGIIPLEDVEGLNPEGPLQADKLWVYIGRSLPEGSALPECPPELVRDGVITRAGLAYALSQMVHGWPF